MKAFLVLCLVATVYGRSSWNPMAPAPEIIESPLRPSLPDVPVTIPEIHEPGTSGIAPPLHIVDLPAEIAPLVQIIVNIQKKDQEQVPVGTFPLIPVEPEALPPVGTFPLFPVEPEVLPPVGTFPLFPVEPEVLPPVGTFPLFPVQPDTKPLPKPLPIPETYPIHNIDLIRPNEQGQNIELIQPGTIF